MARTFPKLASVVGALGVALLAASASSAARADAAKGAAIAQNGLPNVTPCSACHGDDGAGMQGVAPRLAGLSKDYIAAQLANFRTGVRKNPIMEAIAAPLTPQQSEDLADYYSAATPPSHPVTAAASLLKSGEQLAEQGNAADGVPACQTCHGAGGIGVAPSVPYLAGQDAAYLVHQIEAWRGGVRGDPLGLMKPVATKLTDAQAYAAAAYFASLSAPKSQGQK